MNKAILSFSKKSLVYNLIGVFIISSLPFWLGGFTFSTISFCFFIVLLCVRIFLYKIKSFTINSDELKVTYVMLNYSVKIKLHEIKTIYYHERIAERDDNYIKIYTIDGKRKKFSFLFTNKIDQTVFFDLLSEYCLVEKC